MCPQNFIYKKKVQKKVQKKCKKKQKHESVPNFWRILGTKLVHLVDSETKF